MKSKNKQTKNWGEGGLRMLTELFSLQNIQSVKEKMKIESNKCFCQVTSIFPRKNKTLGMRWNKGKTLM